MSEKAPVISVIYGRLGNCLSEIACGYSYAVEHDRPYKVFHGDHQPNDPAFLPLLGRFEMVDGLPENQILITEENYGECDKDVEFPDDITIVFNGYFQEERFYNKEVVLKAFEIPDGLSEKIFEKYGDLSDYVSINVRRGDFVSIGIALDHDWYEDAYKKYFDGQKVFICSDDINWCKENIKIDGAVFAEGNTPIEDLYSASFCKNHIVYNGSFGWWAAYLGQHEGTTTVISKGWFKNLPEGWIEF